MSDVSQEAFKGICATSPSGRGEEERVISGRSVAEGMAPNMISDPHAHRLVRHHDLRPLPVHGRHELVGGLVDDRE